jgi:hypothetical protein
MEQFSVGIDGQFSKTFPSRRDGQSLILSLILDALRFAGIALCLGACGLPLQQMDVEDFIEKGTTDVAVSTVTFKMGSATLSRAISGRELTCDVTIANPKTLDISYTLSWDVDDAFFVTPPPTDPKPTNASGLTFSFVLNPSKAEHKTITFSLGKYASAINKTYEPNTFSILCDSPPHPPELEVAMDTAQKSTLAVRLPSEPSDDDLSRLRITWGMEGTTTTQSAVYAISALTALPASASFSSAFDCYFQAPLCVAGEGYAYAVSVLDAADQESSAATVTSTANGFFVHYDGNGNTGGSAPASTGYRFAATVVVSSPGNLSRTDCAFSHWNTAANDSLASYYPGDSFTMPAGDVTLYAQWISNATGVIIGTPVNYQALTFAQALSVQQGGSISIQTSNAALAAVPTGWTWYIDGIPRNETSPTLTLDAATTGSMLGNYVVTATVIYGGVTYSRDIALTVYR